MGKTYKKFYKFNKNGKKEYNVTNMKTIIPNNPETHQWKKSVNRSIRSKKRSYVSNLEKNNYNDDTMMGVPKLGDNNKSNIWCRPGN